MLNSFRNFFTFSDSLIEAIYYNETAKALKLIEQGINVNPVKETKELTPVRLSLLYKNHVVLIALLDKGANPNPCASYYPYDSLLNAQIEMRHDSIVKLIILYGASAKPQELAHTTSEYRDFIRSTEEIYKKRKHLESLVPKASQRQLCKIHEELGNLWLKQAQNESNPDFKSHYEKKAIVHLKLSQNLKSLGQLESFDNGEDCVNYSRGELESSVSRPLLRRRHKI